MIKAWSGNRLADCDGNRIAASQGLLPQISIQNKGALSTDQYCNLFLKQASVIRPFLGYSSTPERFVIQLFHLTNFMCIIFSMDPVIKLNFGAARKES